MYYLLIVCQLEILRNFCYLFAPNCSEKGSFPKVSKGSLDMLSSHTSVHYSCAEQSYKSLQ